MGSRSKPPGTGTVSMALRVRLALLIFLLVAAASRLRACDAASGFCAGKCAVRCANSKKKGLAPSWCMKQCGLCCEECACVPTGRIGSRDECPCYRHMLTAGPRKTPKCP